MQFYTNVTPWGNNLLVREYVNGERINRKVKYSPTLFCKVLKETGYKTLDGQNVTPIKHETIKEAKEWLKSYEDQPHLVYGNSLFQYNYIADEYPNYVKWDIDKILVVTIDIEVACENGFPNPEEAIEPLLSITIKNHQNKQILVWGTGEYKNTRDDVTYIKCDSEKMLIQEFLTFWEKNQPDVVTGWNTEFFDIPYLCNRIKNLYDAKEINRLSPWGNVSDRLVYKMGRKQQVYDILGVSHLDFYDLYRKFTYTNRESYRLDHIAHIELGESKDDNPYETFREWYLKDFQSFIDYNIQDVEIVDRLEDKMRLIELCLTMAYDAKVNYMDVLGSVKYWDILIYNELRKKNIVIPQKIQREKNEKFEGAYVKDPIVGLHKWVMSFDLNSLYPHLIMQYNISPETLVANEKVKNMSVEKLLNKEVDTSILKDATMTPNGALFKTTQKGFLPELMQKMYDDRVKFKQLMIEAQKDYEKTKDPKLQKTIAKFNNIQMAKKISLNSAYGAIGNVWFRYYNLLVAEAITTSGQLAIRYIEHALNEYLNKILNTRGEDYIIASDTDSVYITFDKLVTNVFVSDTDDSKVVEFLDRVAKEKIEPFIDKSYQDLAEYVNAYEQKMQMKREVIADKGIWVAKKRYILNAHDVEGVRYKEPKLKIMGVEAVKSSTPEVCRGKIKDAIRVIMNDSEDALIKFVADFKEVFKTLSPEEVAFPRSCNYIDKYVDPNSIYKKGTPIHVKGALVYNHHILKNKLQMKYPLIKDGDKIKFLMLRQPNTVKDTVISFATKIPYEFDLHKYVDYETQFTKTFTDPLRFVLDSIGWKLEREATLESFFV